MLGQEGRAGRFRESARPRRLRLHQLSRTCRRVLPRSSPRIADHHVARNLPIPVGDPEQFSVTNPAIVVGSQGLHATGYALGAHLERRRGSQRSPTSVTAQQVRVTSPRRWDLPPVSVSALSSSARTTSGPSVNRYPCSPVHPSRIGRSVYGIPAIRVDGNDVLAVLAVTRIGAQSRTRRQRPDRSSRRSPAGWARTRPPTIRAGTAPIRICRSGKAAIRSSEWRLLLGRRDLLGENELSTIAAAADDVAAGLRRATIALADPPPSALFDHVYAEAHPLIDAEREEHRAYLGSLEGASS